MAITAGETYEWTFTTAQTNTALVTVGATERMDVTYAQVNCTNSDLRDVWVRVGLATATLPTVTLNSATGNIGMILSHPDVSRPGGATAGNGLGVITRGALGADLRISCPAIPWGKLIVLVQLRILTDQ